MLQPDVTMLLERSVAYGRCRPRVAAYLSQFKTRPFEHQVEGTTRLVAHPTFALFDEMGVAKSKQVVDAACILFKEGVITTVVIVAPAAVRRRVWADAEEGEITKHNWCGGALINYPDSVGASTIKPPYWITISYELLRNPGHLEMLTSLLRNLPGDKLLILDEAHACKSRTAKQSKAVAKLRAVCQRCALLTGTPIANNPLDVWTPARIMDPASLPFKNFWQFRARYAVMGGYMNKQPIRWVNLDELQRLLVPYVLRREKRDCLDLPPKLYESRETPLAAETWRVYRELREEAIAALGGGNEVMTPNAGVKLLRLAQVTNGFLGGVSRENGHGEPEANVVKPLGTEKERALIELLDELADRRAVVWCRFRYQIERLKAVLAARPTFQLWGGQSAGKRDEELAGFKYFGDAVLLAQPQAGGQGINDLVAADQVVYLSNDFNLLTRQQSEDRSHRPGQLNRVTYTDVLATGPGGQRTVDHAILKALRRKEDLAALTTAYWRNEI